MSILVVINLTFTLFIIWVWFVLYAYPYAICSDANLEPGGKSELTPTKCPKCGVEWPELKLLNDRIYDVKIRMEQKVIPRDAACFSCGGSGVVPGGTTSTPHPFEFDREMPVQRMVECPECKGCGRVPHPDGDLVIPKRHKTCKHEYTYQCLSCRKSFLSPSRWPSGKPAVTEIDTTYHGIYKGALARGLAGMALITFLVAAWVTVEGVREVFAQYNLLEDRVWEMNKVILKGIGWSIQGLIVGSLFGWMAGCINYPLTKIIQRKGIRNAAICGSIAAVAIFFVLDHVWPKGLGAKWQWDQFGTIGMYAIVAAIGVVALYSGQFVIIFFRRVVR